MQKKKFSKKNFSIFFEKKYFFDFFLILFFEKNCLLKKIHFWSFKIIFEPKINWSALKGLMLRLKIFFDFLTFWPTSTHTWKKKIEFLDFCPKFLQILKFQMWIFRRKFGRSPAIGQKFRPKTFVSPIFLPKKFWAKSDDYQRIKCKKTPEFFFRVLRMEFVRKSVNLLRQNNIQI